MRKTITGTGGMLLLQTLKDAGVEYLFTNPGSAETGIFAALAEDQRLVVGQHEGLVAAMADGYHRLSGKVGVVIAHVMGGSYQVVRTNWAREVPDSKMVRDGRYPGLFLAAPATDYVALARSQGVEGEAVTTVKDLEPALRRGMARITRDNRPYLIDVTVAREGVGADSTWYQDWQL